MVHLLRYFVLFVCLLLLPPPQPAQSRELGDWIQRKIWERQRRRATPPPGEMRSQQERVLDFGVTEPGKCQNVVRRLQRAGYRAKLIRARRNNVGSGGVLNWICEIQTDAPSDFYSTFGGQD